MSAILATEPLVGEGDVSVQTTRGPAGAPQVSVLVPWPLCERDAETTRAGAAALLLVAPEDIQVLSELVGAPRSLTDTLRAVTTAIREARA